MLMFHFLILVLQYMYLNEDIGFLRRNLPKMHEPVFPT